jgi:hypothetical protein
MFKTKVKKRKTPIEHDVNSYRKKTGRYIHKYKRGSGVREEKPVIEKTKVLNGDKKFTVIINYGGDSQSLNVSGKSYDDILNRVTRVATKAPLKISMRMI